MTAVCVIGDIFDDYVADLAPDPRVIRSIVSGSGYDVPSSIAHVVGGAGIQFAVAAAKLGAASTTLIGKVGGARSLDSSAERAEAYMDEAGIRSILAIDQSTHTGRAIVSYLPQGRRLMISDVGANATFCSDDLTDTMYDAVSSSDLLYVSGFSLVQPSRREATLVLVKHAKRSGSQIVLDVVPHQLDRYVHPSIIVNEVLTSADWVFAASVTARRLLQLKSDVGEDALLARLCWDGRSGAVFSHPSTALVQRDGHVTERFFEYFEGSRSRGQSARAHAEILSRFWSE